MHFHLPKPLHGWREFSGEVGIIVIGVLIALAAEQVVEDWSLRNKVGSAESAMRLELADDVGLQAYGRAAIGNCLAERIRRIHDGAGRVPAAQLRQWIADYLPPMMAWDSEAWKATLASDAGSHMGARRLIAWSAPYRLIPWLGETNAEERKQVVDLHSALPPLGDPSPQEIQRVRQLSAQLANDNATLGNVSKVVLIRSDRVGASMAPATARALVERARALYGNCVVVPDLNPSSKVDLDFNLRLPLTMGD
jgi:hypothetical protein